MSTKYTHAELVELVARAKRLESEAKEADQAARSAIESTLGHKFNRWTDTFRDPVVLSTELGRVSISPTKGRETLDKTQVAKYLTPGQFAQCLKVGAESYQVRYTPPIPVSGVKAA